MPMYAASLALIPDGPAKTNGISVGQQAAAGILLFRANDGRDAVVPYVPGSGPGVWIPTPPGFLAAQAPEVAYVRPFTLNSPSQFRRRSRPIFRATLGFAITTRPRVSERRPAARARPNKPI